MQLNSFANMAIIRVHQRCFGAKFFEPMNVFVLFVCVAVSRASDQGEIASLLRDQETAMADLKKALGEAQVPSIRVMCAAGRMYESCKKLRSLTPDTAVRRLLVGMQERLEQLECDEVLVLRIVTGKTLRSIQAVDNSRMRVARMLTPRRSPGIDPLVCIYQLLKTQQRLGIELHNEFRTLNTHGGTFRSRFVGDKAKKVAEVLRTLRKNAEDIDARMEEIVRTKPGLDECNKIIRHIARQKLFLGRMHECAEHMCDSAEMYQDVLKNAPGWLDEANASERAAADTLRSLRRRLECAVFST